MAEFPDFGEHCSVKNCNILDFLPFSCPVCEKKYCVNHQHNHGCNPEKLRLNDPLPTSSGKPLFVNCEFEGCNQREYHYVECRACTKVYCPNHRNTHNCPENYGETPKPPSTSLQSNKTPAKSSDECKSNLGQKYPPVKPGGGESMRRKVAEMRHKSRMMNEYGGNIISTFIKTPDGSLYPICVPPSRTVSHCMTDILKQCNLGPDFRNKAHIRHESNSDEEFSLHLEIGPLLKKYEKGDLVLVLDD